MGLVHIYFGDGKGKTTAALGLALRALGDGMRVCVCQFLKFAPSGEVDAFARFENASVLRAEALRTNSFGRWTQRSARTVWLGNAPCCKGQWRNRRACWCWTKRYPPVRQARFAKRNWPRRSRRCASAPKLFSLDTRRWKRCFRGRIT